MFEFAYLVFDLSHAENGVNRDSQIRRFARINTWEQEIFYSALSSGRIRNSAFCISSFELIYHLMFYLFSYYVRTTPPIVSCIKYHQEKFDLRSAFLDEPSAA